MATAPIALKVLLRQRHWQTYRVFCREYDRAAKQVDAELVGGWPSRAQLHRWLSGELKGLPYSDHCQVLEKMFDGWTTTELFAPYTPSCEQQAKPDGAPFPDDSPTPEPHTEMRIFVDINEQDNRLIAKRLRTADSIFFVAHTGYNAMVSQYQAAIREAVMNGAALWVVVSDPDGPLMQHEALTSRLCPSIRQAGEIKDVIDTCRRHRLQATQAGKPGDNIQVKLYTGPPSMNAMLTGTWLRMIPYLPLVDAAESPVFEYDFDPADPGPLVRKLLTSIERLWSDATPVDIAETTSRPANMP